MGAMNKLLWGFSTFLVVQTKAFSALEPISDQELSDYTGQAFINFEKPEAVVRGSDTFTYTRINLGLKLETILNIDELVLGKYEDSRDVNNAGADIDMNDVALGTYFNPHDYYEVDYWGNIEYGSDGLPRPDPSKFPINPETGQRFTEADAGAPMPFVADNPYFEFAFKEDGSGTQSIEGVRLGFEGASGIFTTNINTLSGNLDVVISDTAEALGSQNPDGFFGVLLKYLGPVLLGDSRLSTNTTLVRTDAGHEGEKINYRAQSIGIEAGTNFHVDASDVGALNWGLLDAAIALLAPSDSQASTTCTERGLFGICTGGTIDMHTVGCDLIGIESCYPLTKFQSIDLGRGGPVKGFFLGTQGQEVPWRSVVWQPDDPSNPASEGEYVQGIVNAAQGYFLNIPSGGTQLNLTEAVNNGLPRQTTRYTDASLGLF